MPNGEAAIIFNLRDDPLRIYDALDSGRHNSYGHAMLSGARANCFVIDTCQQERVVGIQFRAGGAFPFFRMPGCELEGESFALDDLWPMRAGEIRARLLAAETVDVMFAILECCLLDQLVRPLELHPAVTYALQQFRSPARSSSVAAVTARIGLSQRRFIQLFHQQVGLTPKTFSRVRRFQRVLYSIHAKREVDWAQLALDCGYYDQAHFIHDFQAFSGLTPRIYMTLATPHLNHVPLV